jgi:hypothetical protein
MSRLRLVGVFALIMCSETALSLLHRVVNRYVRSRERMRFAAGAMPLSGEAARNSHYAKRTVARVERELLDMNDLGRRHQRWAQSVMMVQARSYGKDA